MNRFVLVALFVLTLPTLARTGDCYHTINDCPGMGYDDVIVSTPDAASCMALCSGTHHCASPYTSQSSWKRCSYSR